MKTTLEGLLRISIDQGSAARTFYVERAINESIKSCGLSFEFEEAAFKSLVFLKDRIDLADDVWEVDLNEEFELPQGPQEGLPRLWLMRFDPRSKTYFAEVI